MMQTGASPFDLRDRVAIVTGAGQGIGFGIAKVLRACGATVVVNDLNRDRAQAAVDTLGDRTLAIAGDVCSEASAAAIVDEVLACYGRIDILVNNAGVSGQRARTLDQKLADWQRIVDVNLRGPYVMARAVGRCMIKQRSGSIVNIVSTAALRPVAADNDYGPTKAALIQMTKSLALDFARRGIRVNAVAPGVIDTPLSREVLESLQISEEATLARIPLHRIGSPEDIGHAVAFLASELAQYITGVMLPVDGGQSL